MALIKARQSLQAVELPMPKPGPGQVLVKVHVCAVCRTDLHVVDGELPNPKLPLVPGHQIVGRVAELGAGTKRFKLDERIGIPWLGWTDGTCKFCKSGRENLCDSAKFTGYSIDGGYAEYTVADERFCFPIPERYTDAEAAPLLCAGMIGYRTLMKTVDAERVGFYGFGSAALILAQVAKFQHRKIYAFTRAGDLKGQEFARGLGAVWAGDSDTLPPVKLDAALIFAPAGELVPKALKSLDKGGVVVCGGIHMSDISAFPYEWLWEERSITSVANLTRRDGEEFLALAPKIPIVTEVSLFPLAQANEAIESVRHGKIKGAAVLVIDDETDKPQMNADRHR